MRNLAFVSAVGLLTVAFGLGCSGGASSGGDSDTEISSDDEAALSASTGGAEDSYTTTFDSTVARGSHTYVKVGATSQVTQKAYLKFTVSGLPSNATSIQATLKLQAQSTSTDAIEAHLASSNAWSESTLVLSNAPAPQATVLAKTTGTTNGAWSTWDVSAAVKANATYSFVLSVPSGAVVSFASKEAGSAVAPQLVVTYKQAAVATTRFGAAFNPHSATRLEQLAGEWGGMQVTRSYDGGSGVKPFLSTYQALDVAHNAASAYSFKYSPTEVTAGTHDAEVRSFFQGIADNHPVYWTYWHEPDDEIFKNHTFTATAYRDAWAHLRAIHDSVKQTRGAAMQTFATFICMEYSMRPNIAPSRPLTGSNGMYPGDAVIDIFGVDSYNAAAPGGVTDAATQFGKVIDFAQQHGKPWAIGELGSVDVTGNPSGRATYLKNAISYWKSRASEPAYVAYFDLVYGSNDYTFDDDAAATKVWHDAVTLGYSAF